MSRPVDVLVLFVLLSGCLGASNPSSDDSSGPGTPSAAEPEVGENYGSITGSVTDLEKRPLPGAEVALLGEEIRGQTDAQGAFTFNELLPGQYTVAASRLGYAQRAATALVDAEKVTTVTLELEETIVPSQPRASTVTHDGYLQCSVGVVESANPCEDILPANKDHFPVVVDPLLPLAEVVFELAWEPGTVVTGQELMLQFCQPSDDSAPRELGCLDSPGPTIQYQTGPSPIVMKVDSEKIPLNETLAYEAWVGSGWFFHAAGLPVPATFAWQQKFTLHVTFCYIDECPNEFTALQLPASG